LETTQTLLMQIAKYSGFSKDLGLFDGKMGVAILLYHGSRFFCSSEMELVADNLMDDILEEKMSIFSINSHGFNKDTIEIAWGFNHLIINGFIESSIDFFDDIDKLLFLDEANVKKMSIAENLFLGLYILSRYENSREKNYWVGQADLYCNQIFKLVKTYPNLFVKRTELLTPYWYCLLKWRQYNLPFMIQNENIIKVCRFINNFDCKDVKTNKAAINKQFFYKFCQHDEVSLFPEIVTICDINTIFLNKLIYQDLELPQQELLDKSITHIISDNRMLNELSILFNPQSIGISSYISGFAWTLLQYKSSCGTFKKL